MPPTDLKSQVTAALAALQNPRLGKDLIAAGMVRDLVEEYGVVQFTFLLGRDDPATLARDARRAVKAVPGVSDVRVTISDPGAPRASSQGPGRAFAGRFRMWL